MKLLEYKAHEIFKRFDLPCSDGNVAASLEELKSLQGKVNFPTVIKAQVQTGGRGKAGGVQFAENDAELITKGSDILSMKIKDLPVNRIFITDKVDIEKEMYLSFTLDRRHKKTVMIFSPEGGVDINEIAEKHPEKVVKVLINPGTKIDDFVIEYAMDKTGFDRSYINEFKNVCRKLYDVFINMDCMLAEINPLIIDKKNRIMAIDGKIDIDDNSLFKHEDIREFKDEIEENPLVLEARKFDFLYIPVKDQGNIAVVSNGSGMIMSTIDLISKKGMTVTSALDLGGGATAERIKEALRIIASNPRVDTIFINIFGGITRCDEIAGGIKSAMKDLSKTRIVARLEGTNKETGLEILDSIDADIQMADGLVDGVEKLAREILV